MNWNVYRVYFIWLLLVLSTLLVVYGQERRQYYSLGFSFQGESVEGGILGDLKIRDYQIETAYVRRINRTFPFNISNKTIDLGYGVRGSFSHSLLRAKQLTQSNSAFEIAPVVRLFLLHNGFLEVGYSFKYFLYGHVFIRDSSTGIVVNLPSDKGFESGITLGIGYIFDINYSISIEPRLEFNFNNFSESETGYAISDDIIRNIRLIIGINLVRSK